MKHVLKANETFLLWFDEYFKLIEVFLFVEKEFNIGSKFDVYEIPIFHSRVSRVS